MSKRYSEAPGWAGAMHRRLGNPMEWSRVDLTLVMMGASCLPMVGVWVWLVFAQQSSLAPYLNVAMVDLLRHITEGLLALWLCMALVLWRRRRTRIDRPGLIDIYAMSWAIYCGLVNYFIGLFSTPFWLLLLAGATIASALLGRRTTGRSVALGTATVVGAMILERVRMIPYAPIFVRPPYDDAGQMESFWMLSMGVVATFTLVPMWLIVMFVVERWKDREQRFITLSTTDMLTGIPNRRQFMQRLDNECERAQRAGSPVSVLMCDADHFKRVNDSHGHQMGDEVLRAIARSLKDQLRTSTDVVGRVGGEEFAVVLGDTALAEAATVAQRMVEATRSLEFQPDGREAFHVTLSIGVACLAGADAHTDALLEAADRRLYAAKNNGRDRVVSDDTEG